MLVDKGKQGSQWQLALIGGGRQGPAAYDGGQQLQIVVDNGDDGWWTVDKVNRERNDWYKVRRKQWEEIKWMKKKIKMK